MAAGAKACGMFTTYVCEDGDIEEWFSHYRHVNEARPSVSLFEHDKQVFIKFNCGWEFVD
jgi:hypothetical protein